MDQEEEPVAISGLGVEMMIKVELPKLALVWMLEHDSLGPAD